MRDSGLLDNTWSMTSRCGMLATAILLLSLAFTGCGGGGGAMSALSPSAVADSPADDWPVRTVALAQTLKDLESLEAPDGVDPELFATLKDELGKVLEDLYGGDPAAREARRNASAIDPADTMRAWCLQGKQSSGGTVTVVWRGRNVGDYNLDGLVAVADLTPLGFHFNASVALNDIGLPVVDDDNEWKAQVDGDQNGLISVSDITPIGMNFNARLLGYRVYFGSSADGETINWSETYEPCPDDEGAPYSVAYNTSREPGEVLHYTYEVERPSIPENTVLYVKVVAFDGTAEAGETISALPDGPHATMQCELCHRITDLVYYGEDQSCLLCHREPSAVTTLTWDDAPGLHNMCMFCHVEHSFSVPIESSCAICHAEITAAVAAANMPDCLGCHETGHFPNAEPAQSACLACHPTPPENNLAAWESTPSLHNQCYGCHQVHGFTIDPPESVCGDCHDALISAGHAEGLTQCLGCHENAHLPELTMSGDICVNCHTTPPEDATASWDDAPGQHADCELCHDATDHGDKPVPPESICGDCHGELIAAGHAGGSTQCMDCHTFAHLPDSDIGTMACTECHVTPPEDAAASWDDAPGQHDQCAQCHDSETHGDKPEPAESICGDCHSGLISAGHAGGSMLCMGCHKYSHLPVTDISGMDCKECHLTPPENVNASWAETPDQHDLCEQCHDETDHGDKPVPAESICGDCHSDLITAGHAWGISTCLDCHDFAHLPLMDFTSMACADCHTTPPEDPEASWYDAPGQHNRCEQCHDEADHGDKPVPPESICGDCHSDLISAGHAGGSTVCLLCHEFAHLPLTDFTGQNCADCHATPPEDPLASWDDAPGQHDLCALCHDTENHGDKPVPPETICANCHSTLIAGGHAWGISACLDCHGYAHLPLIDFSAWNCTDCHTTPPEDDGASWNDAPGQHGTCGQCHDPLDHGDTPDPPDSICADCHSDIISAGHAWGNTACLGCHTYAHLPLVDFVGWNCTACHVTPPEDQTAGWTDAPGQHDQCSLCHDSADHGDKPDPPDSICANCHSALISGGHAWGNTACLSCHSYPHIPDTLFSEWDCTDCHVAPPEDETADWDDAPGSHDLCSECHDSSDHGDKPVPPQSVCSDCHSALISGGHAWGISTCLDCHAYPHLPEMDFSSWDCDECHYAPPEDLDASWDDAPGQHDNCGQCHDLLDHGDKPVPPQSICGNCHADLISGGHGWGNGACLDCHSYPHLPDVLFDDWDCTDCHTAPPEDPLADWDDAPGSHDLCSECHDSSDHGDKPVPPESVCGDCHSSLIAGGHAWGISTCLDCHTYVHLPITDFSDWDCIDCHTTPPEDPDADWDDAPGLHDSCGECHDPDNHGDMPSPPQSICTSCHNVGGGGHPGPGSNCIFCHDYPHLPVVP